MRFDSPVCMLSDNFPNSIYGSDNSIPFLMRVSMVAHMAMNLLAKAREFQKNIYFCFIDYAKAFDCVDHNSGKFFKRWEYQTTIPAS